ncbi:MAG: hypothetical protein QOJ38_1958 [Solirubrobacterales bacterium]|nr:hypothetical protein [Solirubrobacterales bacterium]
MHQGKGNRRATALVAVAVACAATLLVPALAGSSPYKPDKGKIWAGVSDTGRLEDYKQFRDATGKHPAILETFHGWGTKPGAAYRRWSAAKVRPMLHISTADSFGGNEALSPRGIATGGGDAYLIQLNRFFGGAKKLPAYIRPMGEMNGAHNPYCAFNFNGTARDSAHSTTWFKKAWKRMVILIRGGGSMKTINARLKKQKLPPVKPHGEKVSGSMSSAPVSFVWTPQHTSGPNISGNQPSNYFPGKSWVDWTGTDFYSSNPDWKAFLKFYERWNFKPFAITEWGVALRDQPDFVSEVTNWAIRHRGKVRMLLYYQGFNGDTYSPYRYPSSLAKLRSKLHSGHFPAFTPENG